MPNIHQIAECITGRGLDVVVISKYDSLLRAQ